jgi:Ser/Thr protein kinase RdoA (MazF antagonist)
MLTAQPAQDVFATPEPSLAAFDHLTRGDPAPHWLFRGVAAAWCLDPDRIDLTLITVSENATFLLVIDGSPEGAVRVSQPGYVGGPAAIVSEIAWMNALGRDVAEVNVPTVVPSPRGPHLCVIRDNAGTGWVCVSTKYVEGEVLENLGNPAAHAPAIGRWSALFHEHARNWEAPFAFRRFTWDVDDMVGPSCRWGRWEAVEMDDADFRLLDRAQGRALALVEGRPKAPSAWGLIHADLRPSNILVNGETLTVIDFDDCGFGWYLFDFAAALSFVEHEPYAPRIAAGWFSGYQEINPISTDDLVFAGALSMLRRLSMLGWTTNHREDALPDGLFAAQLPGSVEVASRFLKSPTWLVD